MKLINLLFLIVIVFSGCSGYQVEKGAVYYKHWNEAQGRVLTKTEADPKTFETLGHGYARDKTHVFRDAEIVVGADPETFDPDDECYARDKYRAYYYGKGIDSSDPKTFRKMDDYYSTDGRDIFYTHKALHVCNPEKFGFVYKENEEIFERWTTDGCYYYLKEYKVPSDDYAHVQIYKNSGGLAKDRRWVYYLDRKLNWDDEGNKILDTVDVATFTVTGLLECHDKFGYINVYHGRKDPE